MTDKSQRLAKLLLVAGGTAIGIFIIAKYRKNILKKLTESKNAIFYDYAKLQRKRFQVEIINSANDCESIIQTLREHCGDFPVVGFDCEWVTVNSERRKVALIQLCSSQGLCALFRVCKFSSIPANLKSFLEDPEIIKTGVTPQSDAKYLLQDYALSVNSTFDLRFLALITNHNAEGLAKLSKSVLNIEVDKNWRVRCSDWEIENMSREQVDYAAKDAFVAVEIFRKLYRSVRNPSMSPEVIRRFCDNYTDITFKNKLAQLNLDPASGNSLSLKFLRAAKSAQKISYRSYSARTKPLYHNCLMLAPDGEVLCTCDRQKAEWYVKKGLGVEIEGRDVYTVQLNFEPAGRVEAEYYKSYKENRCVVCGSEKELIRKNIVPHEYQKFFPDVMKVKTSHDILLLCISCHQLSNMSDLKIRQSLESQCNAPLAGIAIEEAVVANRKLEQDQRLARALLRIKHLPEQRKVELKAKLSEAYPGQEITEEFLESLLKKKKTESTTGLSHGQLVVNKFKRNEGLVTLEKMWRQHFLKAMEPRFMPLLWDVNHNETRLEARAIDGRVGVEDLKFAGIEAKLVEQQKSADVEAKIVKYQKSADVEAKIVPLKQPVASAATGSKVEASPDKSQTEEDQDDNVSIDTSSDWEFRSAVGSVNSSTKLDLDRTLTEDDDRYFSDVQSFYETIRSDSSTLDDFQSFASSLTERPLGGYDSDDSGSSRNFSMGSDTEVEDNTEVEDQRAEDEIEL